MTKRLTRDDIRDRNLGMRHTNKSGVSGVYQMPGGKWRAQIRVNGRNLHIGCFDTAESAATAKKEAGKAHGFHPNHS